MENEKQEIKEKIISFLSEDHANRKYLVEQIERVSDPQLSDYFYSNLIDLFVHLSVEEEEAKRYWEEIFVHYEELCSALNRDVGLRLAIFDYFLNLNKSLENPMLVEIMMFKEAEQYAMFDPLTGLFNRRYFDINFGKELQRARRYGKDLSILLLDIDDFKKINDTKGHLFGDEVLSKFAAFLEYMSREEDIICRYGGEEFVVVMPETMAKGALRYANRLRDGMKKEKFFKQYQITFSGGIAPYPQAGSSAPQLIANADDALYEAKLAGKDQVLLSKKEYRGAFRYPKTIQVYLQPLGQEKESENLTPCITRDISFEGMRVEVDEKHEIGEKVLLHIELPDKDKLVVVGEVIWSNTEDGPRNVYGIKYLDLFPEQLMQMESLLPQDFAI